MSDTAIRVVTFGLALGIVFGIHSLQPSHSLHCKRTADLPAFCQTAPDRIQQAEGGAIMVQTDTRADQAL